MTTTHVTTLLPTPKDTDTTPILRIDGFLEEFHRRIARATAEA